MRPLIWLLANTLISGLMHNDVVQSDNHSTNAFGCGEAISGSFVARREASMVR